MSGAHSGGCQCGAIRYQVEEPLLEPSLCHCRSCQKAHAAPAVSWITVPLAKLHWTRGAVKSFQSSPRATRGFCSDCGTVITWLGTGAQDIDIAMASLDHPEIIAPLRQNGVEARMPWFATAPSLPEEHMDPLGTSYQHPDHDTNTWPPRHDEQ